MINWLIHIDQQAFLFLNGLHCPFLDTVMFWGTKSLIWLPLFLFLLYLTIRKYRWQTLWILLFTALMVTFSDQLANVFKEWIARPRPSHEPGLTGVNTVNGYSGGMFGFYSGHASTTMAIAVFMIVLLQDRYRFLLPLLLLWAVFMSYTRIYLGVHYPLDILTGMALGAMIGYGTAFLCRISLLRMPLKNKPG
ncbi:MAG: phosphatase PAP2 family protein [Bacteroidales bacterium]|nr:phosphatase PAP2 family protein [Bacteroidales bacterium]